MFSGQFYEMWVSVWERNIKLLLETVICIISAVEISNYIIATETVTCIIATERSTNIPVTKYHLKTCINAADVVTCIIAIESVSCIVPTETATCRIDYRNFHLQKWCQSETLLVIIKKFSEWVRTKFKAK